VTGRSEPHEVTDGARRQRAERQHLRQAAVQRRHQAEQLARQAGKRVRLGSLKPGRPIVYLLGLFLVVGAVASAIIVTTQPPEVSRNQVAFLVASGAAVWGLVGLAVVVVRRKTPARMANLVAYDALRQGLLIAGCLELNLATRMLDLWTPLIGGLLVAVFALFEIVTLGRRPT
jgi:hypothetical protein